jgi:hypothetical protein
MSTEQQQPQKQPPIHIQGKKLRKIVKPKKTITKTLWLAGHVSTLVFGTIYAMFYLQMKSQGRIVPWICYKLALIGVSVSYALSIQSQYNIKSLPHYSTLIASENYQYFMLSIIWFFNRNSLLKLMPYMVVSLLQLANKFHLEAILKMESTLSAIVLYSEMLLIVVLFVDTLLIRGTSGYGLVIYVMFMWLRVLQNENTRFFIYDNIFKLDTLMSKIKNEKVQNVWKSMKKFLTLKQAKFEQKYLQ